MSTENKIEGLEISHPDLPEPFVVFKTNFQLDTHYSDLLSGAPDWAVRQVVQEVAHLQTENSQLTARVAELEKDKERLDWLEAHPLKAEVKGGADDGDTAKYWAISSHHTFGIRQAIDAAMKGPQ